MTETFKPGDQVVLKSGGPQMTVIEHNTGTGMVVTTWFDKTDKPQSKDFISEALKRIPPQD